MSLPMRVISATILDSTHLQLSQPLALPPGHVVDIVVRDANESDDGEWHAFGRDRAINAYADEDAVYDEL